jgi:hypothetical protein
MKLLAIFAGIALAVSGSTSAFAEPVLDFAMITPATGLISQAGGTAPLVGSGISLKSVTGLGTPLQNKTTQNCLNCFLNFSTGNALGATGGVWNFVGGGSISITGTVDLNNNGVTDAADATGTLMSGNFVNASLSAFGPIFIAGAQTTALLNTTLTNFYGTDPAPFTYRGGFNLSFLSFGSTPNGFSSTSMLNGGVIAATPEPMSIALLGTVLLGWGILSRRRFLKQ